MPTSSITFSCSDDLPTAAPHHVWVVQWDGSHMPCGAVIGLTIRRQNCPPAIAASIPVHARDATRTEALGPPIAALLLSTLPPTSHYHFIGDSRFVVDMFTSRTSLADLFHYHFRKLACDLIDTRLLQASWVLREFNKECDALARAAATFGSVTLTTQAEF